MGRNILVIGQGPLPSEPVNAGVYPNAPSIRAWHFARALQEASHMVSLLSINDDQELAPHQLAPGLTLYSPSVLTITDDPEGLNRLVEELQIEAVVCASVWPSYLASLFLPPTLPLWSDLFGSPLAEGQAKAAMMQDDSGIEAFARFEATVLSRADRVSAVSSYQEYATIGAMATHGRLNQATDGYRLAYTIPATLDPEILPASDTPFLRGKIVPEDAFVVLWSGGFNTWTDIDTLFNGLDQAMAASPNLHFVSTGGTIVPHDTKTYPYFEKLVANSAHRDRYHLLGWQPQEGLHNYYLESDLGIVLDRWSYEGVLGSRTRLLDWLLYGLPVVLTVTAELTEQLVDAGLAFSFPHGNGEALANLLTRLTNDPAEVRNKRGAASQFVTERFAYGIACKPLLEWAEYPCLAPDTKQPLPEFASSSNPVLERRLAEYEAQIQAKNIQIGQLESWAKSMEERLKNKSGGWRKFFRR